MNLCELIKRRKKKMDDTLNKHIWPDNDIAAALKAGEAIAALQNIKLDTERENTPILVKDGFYTEIIDNRLPRPLRKRGKKTFTDARSFCHYVNKHKSEDETVIIADEDQGVIQAVIDDHGSDRPAWGNFIVNLNLGFSDQWLTWYNNAWPQRDSFFSQAELADFIEDNRSDLKTGDFSDADGNEVKNLSPLELTYMINNLQITREEKITSELNPNTGEVKLLYENERKGKGNVTLPSCLFLAIPVYKKGDLFQVKIRLRQRAAGGDQGGKIHFYFIVDEVPLFKQTAFDKICRRITDGDPNRDTGDFYVGTDLPVLRGNI